LDPADPAGRRHRWLLFDDVRAAKERLSGDSRADVHLPTLDTDAYLTRTEFEDLGREPLAATVACLRRTVGNAGLRPGALAAVFGVGGSSRTPLAARLIHRDLGVPATVLDRPETVVAAGALAIGAAQIDAGTAPSPSRGRG